MAFWDRIYTSLQTAAWAALSAAGAAAIVVAWDPDGLGDGSGDEMRKMRTTLSAGSLTGILLMNCHS